MAKYSYELKKEVVMAYINGEWGCEYLAKKHGVAHRKSIVQWIAAYKKFGDEGLMRSRKNKEYTLKFKLHVVELYLTTEVSYQELALSVGINNAPLITKWVNDFRIAGPDALKSKSKGRKKTLKLSHNNNSQKHEKLEKQDSNNEYVKQLEDELLRLRIENAYLKELRRLRLEEKALLKKKRELSTVSEENSN